MRARSSMVEQWPFKPLVAGSSPAALMVSSPIRYCIDLIPIYVAVLAAVILWVALVARLMTLTLIFAWLLTKTIELVGKRVGFACL